MGDVSGIVRREKCCEMGVVGENVHFVDFGAKLFGQFGG